MQKFNSALVWAAKREQWNVVKVLIENNANIDARNAEVVTVLYIVRYGNSTMNHGHLVVMTSLRVCNRKR